MIHKFIAQFKDSYNRLIYTADVIFDSRVMGIRDSPERVALEQSVKIACIQNMRLSPIF